MSAKFKLQLSTSLTVLILLAFTEKAIAQNGGINGWIKKQSDKLNKKVDQVFNGKNNGTTNPEDDTKSQANGQSSGRPKFSELKDEDFIQNKQNPQRDNSNTRYMIAKDLRVDIKGIYPNGYAPKWRFISYNSNIRFGLEDWLRPKAQLGFEDRAISIGDYNGKATIRFKPHFDCECFADILVKDSFSVLTENPQVYEIGNFRKILNERSTGEPCVGGLSNAAKGGWGGKIKLSANANGDLVMSLMLEDYTLPYTKTRVYNNKTHGYDDIFYPSQVNYRFFANDITIENEMSAEKANDILAKEKEVKQKQKDYIAKTTKQADSLQKLIAKKYTQPECRSCFYSSRGSYISSKTVDEYYVHSGDYAGSRTDYDLNTTTVIKNKCNYNITFVGIQQLYDEENGYYLKDVTKIMEAGYNYSADQGIFSSIFTSLIGGGSEFNFSVQDKYAVNYASVGAVQWIKVIKSK